jgi:predicted nucleic acid-binding protein
LRQGEGSILNLRRAARAGEAETRPLWLSVVVLEELYAGATTAQVRKTFMRLERELSAIGRLIVSGQRDWTLAGQVLSQAGLKYGFDLIGRARMINDALIARSTAARGLTDLTKNPDHYIRFSEFRRFSSEAV